ncbi:MAG: ABC transporter ATP-binding protein [Pseudomonadota bacterium]
MSRLAINAMGLTLSGTHVLEDVSLRVEEGEFVSILGPSGAGKSTLFRILTGMVSPDRGTGLYGGRPITPDLPVFAYMPQSDALMPWRRIIDNVTLGLEVQGLSRKAARERALPLFAQFGLSGFERHYPSQLSGGMRQRAALLRTVVQNRPIQLLDEPFGALDALTRMQMQRWLERRRQTTQWTTLLITHDVREAIVLSDRIYVLSSRPARVISEVTVNAPRPRLKNTLPDCVHTLEAQLLETLNAQIGENR